MIRQAEEKDIKEMQVLYEELFEAMHHYQPQFFVIAQQDEEFLQNAIHDEDKLLLVADHKNKIIGFAIALVQHTPAYNCLVPHKYVYIIDIIVDAASRRMGVGKNLLSTVKEWGKAMDAHYIKLSVLAENKEALKLYLREDFSVSSQTMRFNLE